MPKPSFLTASRIEADLKGDLKILSKEWSNLVETNKSDDKELTAQAQIEIAIVEYISLIMKVVQTAAGGLKKRIAYATAKLLDAPEARIAAMVRSIVRSKKPCVPSEVLKKASAFSVWVPLTESVRVHWRPKAGGKFRPICVFGPLRRAQSFMVRDMLMIAGVNPSTNFAKKGSGGERGLVKKVCTLIDEGKDWWWTPDIKSAFPSILPGHFRWLAMDRRLLLNVAFLPKCAKIEMKLPKDIKAFTAYLKAAYPDLLADVSSFIDIAKLVVRRGLTQGSVLSPLLAGAFIARVWSQNVNVHEAVMLSWHDDLFVGTETKAQLKLVKEQVTQAMASLSAGPIEFHKSRMLAANSGKVTVLGYVLQLGRGHVHYKDGSRSIHVKPGAKRIGRFKGRLAEKLANELGFDARRKVAEIYTAQWFNSQTAWTKVPGFSQMNAENCGLTYLVEFEHGQPMGGGWID
jgi:Reverse transcriptase (RNA-dependent DNA polymerase)